MVWLVQLGYVEFSRFMIFFFSLFGVSDLPDSGDKSAKSFWNKLNSLLCTFSYFEGKEVFKKKTKKKNWQLKNLQLNCQTKENPTC